VVSVEFSFVGYGTTLLLLPQYLRVFHTMRVPDPHYVFPVFIKSFMCSQKMRKQPGFLQKGGDIPLLQECV
jgi:hypothetical protein